MYQKTKNINNDEGLLKSFWFDQETLPKLKRNMFGQILGSGWD